MRKSVFLRQESTLAIFTQTKQNCNFVKTGLTTSQLRHCFSQPLPMLQVQMRPHWKDKNTLYNILKLEFLTFYQIYCNKHCDLNTFSLTFLLSIVASDKTVKAWGACDKTPVVQYFAA